MSHYLFKPNSNRQLLIPTILMGFALRLYKLGQQSLWYDETVSAFLASQSSVDLIEHTARDIHPPGYYLLLHLWQINTGNSEFALAFFSLIFGVLLIPLTYILAQYLVNKPVGLLAAFFIAISPYNVWYSQEVRMYTLGAVLGLIAAFCSLRALIAGMALTKGIALTKGTATTTWWYWLGYILAAAIGLYTLYYFAFLLIVLNLFYLFYLFYPNLKSAALKTLLIANALLFILYLPWLPVAWRQATNPPVPSWRSPPTLLSVMIESWSALVLGQSVEPIEVWPVLLIALGVLAFGVYYIHKKEGIPVLFLLLYIYGPLLLIYLLSFITPLYHVRYIFTYSPAFYILLGAGVVCLARRTHLWIALLLVLILGGASLFSLYQFHFDPRYRSDDYRAAVDFIRQRWQPGDVILTNAGYTYPAFVYYAHWPTLERQRLVPYNPPPKPGQPLLLQSGTVDGDPQLGWGDPRSDFYAMSSSHTLNNLEQLAHHHPRLWLLRVYDTVTDPTAVIRTWLADQAIPLEDQPFPGESNIRAQGFLLPQQPAPTSQPTFFEDGMTLAAWRLPPQTWHGGQSIHLQLWWSTTQTPQTDYKISLKLWTPTGELAAPGQDEWPVGTLYRATQWPPNQVVYHPTQLNLPPDLPPGQYWLNVELYHPETIQLLPRLDNGQPEVTLGPIMVE